METFEQNSADNKYLHKDFHISMNMLMVYIRDRYGSTALTEYLRQFSREFHSGLKDRLRSEGLTVLSEYLRVIYEKEEWEAGIDCSEDRLVITQDSCPGIAYIRQNGQEPVEQYIETYTTVYEELCAGTGYEYEMTGFDKETGGCMQVFRKRGVS